jgi:peptidoglycan hydrolase-like protein with peptidoglycan-binding domain
MVFVQAKNYTPTSGRQIDLIVIHDMEAPEGVRTAENVASWFAGDNAPRASAHRCFDADSNIQCVLDKDVAWHAPGANHNGIGYEHAGYARQSDAEWRDPYSTRMLKLSAKQAAADCKRYNLPVRYVDAGGLVLGRRGITTHWEVTKAFKRSTHWDPGANFPMDQYINWVKSDAGIIQPIDTVAVSDGLIRLGDRGAEVRSWQTILVGAKLLEPGGVDGVFGPKTEAATKKFQQMLGVEADGVVGPKTAAATARLLAYLAGQRPRVAVPPFPGIMREGSKGEGVRVVQRRLNELEDAALKVDGVFGNRTEEAVKTFQRAHHLSADGIVGQKTWGALWTSS